METTLLRLVGFCPSLGPPTEKVKKRRKKLARPFARNKMLENRKNNFVSDIFGGES